MVGNLIKLLVFLLMVIAIVAIGWNEPLRYQLMSREKIDEAEKIYQPPPATPVPQFPYRR